MSSDRSAADAGNAYQYSLRDFLTTVFKRKLLIVVVALSVVTVVMTATLMAPRRYEVVSTLLVNKARAEVPLAPTDSPQLVVNQVSEQDLNSEIEILRGRKLLEETLQTVEIERKQPTKRSVLRSVKASIRKLIGGVEVSQADALVLGLQQDLDVRAVRRSNIIRVSFLSDDPQWATTIVGALVDRYLEQRAERYQSPQAVSFFEEQMLAAEKQLEQDEKELETLSSLASITMVSGPEGSDSIAPQKALVMERLSQLESALGDAEVELKEQQSEVVILRSQLEGEPKRLESSSRYNQDATTEEIERGIATLKLERDKLLQDFRPDSRYVRDIETQIRLAEERLETAQSRSGVSRTEANPVYIGIKSDLVRAEAEAEGTKARVDSLRLQVAAHRQKLKTLNEKAFELEGLRRDVKAAEENYLLYRNKHEEARISAAMDQKRFINVTIAQPAQIPLMPVPRALTLRFLLSILLGVLGGAGLAFGLEIYLNRSFTTGEDIERKLGIPHIASIPEIEAPG
jgi:uncharacterized protein involved in exopolysaccharide biosynthesis